MDRETAEAYEKASKHLLTGTFRTVINQGIANLNLPVCTLDPLQTAAVYVANRKKQGGQFLFALGIRDIRNYGGFDSWLDMFAMPAETRMRGQPTTYRWMGIHRVELIRNPRVTLTAELLFTGQVIHIFMMPDRPDKEGVLECSRMLGGSLAN